MFISDSETVSLLGNPLILKNYKLKFVVQSPLLVLDPAVAVFGIIIPTESIGGHSIHRYDSMKLMFLDDCSVCG